MTEQKSINWKRWVVRGLISIVLCASLLGGCSYLNRKLGVKDDHFVEEMAERFIESETGLDIDLTPESPEL